MLMNILFELLTVFSLVFFASGWAFQSGLHADARSFWTPYAPSLPPLGEELAPRSLDDLQQAQAHGARAGNKKPTDTDALTGLAGVPGSLKARRDHGQSMPRHSFVVRSGAGRSAPAARECHCLPQLRPGGHQASKHRDHRRLSRPFSATDRTPTERFCFSLLASTPLRNTRHSTPVAIQHMYSLRGCCINRMRVRMLLSRVHTPHTREVISTTKHSKLLRAAQQVPARHRFSKSSRYVRTAKSGPRPVPQSAFD